MASISTAVVGLGGVSNHHIEAIRETEHATLSAVCDIDERRARAVAAEEDVDWYTDYEDLVAAGEVQWIHLCTPVGTHYEMGVAAIEAGIPVLIEKPITHTVEAYEQLRATAAAHDVRLTEVHNETYLPAMRRLRSIVESGTLGEIRGVEVLYSEPPSPEDFQRGSWVGSLKGGEFEEGFAHPLYHALNCGGYPRSEADVDVQTLLSDEYDDDYAYDQVQLQYVSEGGVLCTVVLLSGVPTQKQVRVHGTNGAVAADLNANSLLTVDREYGASPTTRIRRDFDRLADGVRNLFYSAVLYSKRAARGTVGLRIGENTYSHYGVIDAEAESLVTGGPSPVPPSETRWTLRLIEAIRETPAVRPEKEVVTSTPESS